MSQKSIIIIGPYPPPIGGVSIHISRLVNLLNSKYKIYKIDTSKNKILQGLIFIFLMIKLKITSSELVVHNHIFRVNTNAFIAFICQIFRVQYIQSIHSLRNSLNKNDLSKIKYNLIKYTLNSSFKVVAVSVKIKKDLIKIDKNLSKKIIVIPAFIPYKENSLEVNTYNDNIKYLQIESFIKNHKIILCANASRIEFFQNHDLYGIDLCIDLIRKLKQYNKYNAGLIFMLPQVSNIEYFNKMKGRINDYGIENDFIFITKKVELVPLLDYIDIFLRPTNTDGDSISIREALYSGIPCIASDVVERPIGTITFKNRDLSDLYKKVCNVIENIENEKEKVKGIQNLTFTNNYFNLYEEKIH